jgi:hypothetical protein
VRNKSLHTSVNMALGLGIFLPLAETVRRSNQLLDPTRFLNWFDDYILGGALLLAVYQVKKQKPKGVSYLIAAWGIGVGAMFLSFLGQFEYYWTATGDPGVFSTTFVAIVKGLILAYSLFGLSLSIQSTAADSLR